MNPERYKILFLAADVDLGEPDGQATHVIGLARAFAQQGVEVRLLVPATPKKVLNETNLFVQYIPNLGLGSFRAALQQAKTFQPDFIYERRFSPKLGAAISIVLKVPFFLEVNGLPETEVTDGASPSRRMRLPNRFYKIPARIVVPSARLAALLQQRWRLPLEKFLVIPNGVDLGLFGSVDKAVARGRFGLMSGLSVVAYVGKLAPWQGLETLIDSAQLLEGEPKLLVLIVGEGPLRGAIASRIIAKHLEERIRLVGSIPHEDVPTILASADVCVAPFSSKRNELIGISPIKLFEYLAAGRPIVASDVAGVREIVEDAGVLVAPDSAPLLASAIKQLIDDPARMANLGRRASDLAKANSWASRARSILDEMGSSPRIPA